LKNSKFFWLVLIRANKLFWVNFMRVWNWFLQCQTQLCKSPDTVFLSVKTIFTVY